MTQITITITASLDVSKLPALFALLTGSEPQVALAAPAAEAPAEAPKTRKGKGAAAQQAAAPAPVVEPPAAPAAPAAPAVTEVTLDPAKNTAPTVDQLRQAAVAAVGVIGQDKLAELIKKAGGTKLSDVPEARRLDLLKALATSGS